MNKSTLYVKSSNGLIVLIVALYVDDFFITGPNSEVLLEFKTQMMSVFEMINLRLMTYFLSMEVV